MCIFFFFSNCRMDLRFLRFVLQVDSFQEYVKPELNPQLSDFCVKLTGITQVSQIQHTVNMMGAGVCVDVDEMSCWTENGGWSRHFPSRPWAGRGLASRERARNKVQIRHSHRWVSMTCDVCSCQLIEIQWCSQSLWFFRAWDMSKFLNIQCQISRIRYPQFAKKWINIRKSYGNFYKVSPESSSVFKPGPYVKCTWWIDQ